MRAFLGAIVLRFACILKGFFVGDLTVFSIVPVEVWADRRLTLEQVRVLGALLSFRGKNTDLVWPSRQQISERTGGMHPANISTATSALENLGWLTKDGKGGHSKATRYRIRVPELTVAESATVAEQATVAESATRTVAESATPPVAESATRKEQTIEQTKEQTKLSAPPKTASFVVMKTDFPECADQVIKDFIAHRKAKRAPLTPTAWRQIASEIRASGWSAEDALTEAMAAGWHGIKADWLAKRRNPTQPKLSAAGQKAANAASRWLESEGFQLEKTA